MNTEALKDRAMRAAKSYRETRSDVEHGYADALESALYKVTEYGDDREALEEWSRYAVQAHHRDTRNTYLYGYALGARSSLNAVGFGIPSWNG